MVGYGRVWMCKREVTAGININFKNAFRYANLRRARSLPRICNLWPACALCVMSPPIAHEGVEKRHKMKREWRGERVLQERRNGLMLCLAGNIQRRVLLLSYKVSYFMIASDLIVAAALLQCF